MRTELVHDFERFCHVSSVPNLFIHTFSPGDGWTRYSVRQKDPANGGEITVFGWTSFTYREMVQALNFAASAMFLESEALQ